MKSIAVILAVAALVTGVPASAQETASQATSAAPVIGKMLYSADGKRLAAVYKLDPTGAPQILLEGKLVTVPVSTLSAADGRVETSLTRKDLMTRH